MKDAGCRPRLPWAKPLGPEGKGVLFINRDALEHVTPTRIGWENDRVILRTIPPPANALRAPFHAFNTKEDVTAFVQAFAGVI